MAETDGFIVYAGQYPSLEAAKDDFAAINALHKADFVGHHESALFTKEGSGKVKIVDTDETARAHGALGGAIAGGCSGNHFPAIPVGLGRRRRGAGRHDRPRC